MGIELGLSNSRTRLTNMADTRARANKVTQQKVGARLSSVRMFGSFDLSLSGRVGLKVVSRQVRHQQRKVDKRNKVRTYVYPSGDFGYMYNLASILLAKTIEKKQA